NCRPARLAGRSAGGQAPTRWDDIAWSRCAPGRPWSGPASHARRRGTRPARDLLPSGRLGYLRPDRGSSVRRFVKWARVARSRPPVTAADLDVSVHAVPTGETNSYVAFIAEVGGRLVGAIDL